MATFKGRAFGSGPCSFPPYVRLVWYGSGMVPVYLDFDGVMNSLTSDVPRCEHKTGFSRWTVADSAAEMYGRHFRLITSDDRNDTVAAWAELASITWLTSWWDMPDDVIARTGIDRPFLAPLPPDDGSHFSWKIHQINAHHEPEDRFVWIDDNDIPAGTSRRYPNALLLRPSYNYGLRRRDTDYIEAWLRGEI